MGTEKDQQPKPSSSGGVLKLDPARGEWHQNPTWRVEEAASTISSLSKEATCPGTFRPVGKRSLHFPLLTAKETKFSMYERQILWLKPLLHHFPAV